MWLIFYYWALSKTFSEFVQDDKAGFQNYALNSALPAYYNIENQIY